MLEISKAQGTCSSEETPKAPASTLTNINAMPSWKREYLRRFFGGGHLKDRRAASHVVPLNDEKKQPVQA